MQLLGERGDRGAGSRSHFKKTIEQELGSEALAGPRRKINGEED
jgi:hypothetical protein